MARSITATRPVSSLAICSAGSMATHRVLLGVIFVVLAVAGAALSHAL